MLLDAVQLTHHIGNSRCYFDVRIKAESSCNTEIWMFCKFNAARTLNDMIACIPLAGWLMAASPQIISQHILCSSRITWPLACCDTVVGARPRHGGGA